MELLSRSLQSSFSPSSHGLGRNGSGISWAYMTGKKRGTRHIFSITTDGAIVSMRHVRYAKSILGVGAGVRAIKERNHNAMWALGSTESRALLFYIGRTSY